MRRLFLSLLILAFTLPAVSQDQTQAKHSFTFDDMMKLKRVGDPQVSPDGKWVIFSVVDVDLEANTKTPHIWIVPLNSSDEKRSAQKSNEDKSGDKSGVPHASPEQGRRVSPNLRDVGATERELISDQDADRPRWAPDGKRFAFLSTKEGGSQVWIANFDGTAGAVTGAYKLTSIPTEAGGELWSPDNESILFVSDVYPECDGASDEIACNAKKVDANGKSKVKALVFDRLLYRHWNAYKSGTRSHIFVATLFGGFPLHTVASNIRDLTPGDYDAPVFSLGGQDNYAFSPDGKEICYASNHDKNEAASTNNDLWIVSLLIPAGIGSGSVAGGRSTWPTAPAKNITADNPASDSTPLYSPDGRYIAYRAQQRPGYESDRFRLMLYDRKTGERKNLTEKLDSWVGTFVWAADSKRIFFVHQSEEGVPVYSFEVNRPFDQTITVDGDPKETARTNTEIVIRDGFNDDLAITPDGRNLVFTRMSISFPIEIYRTHSSRTIAEQLAHPAEKLTHFNDAMLSNVAMSPLESFWFTSAHNDKVQGFLVKPPNFDATKKYPVKFLIHGGPQGAWGDDWSYRWNPELFAANGYVVIMINFHGSNGYGQKFMDAINGDWGGAPYEDLMKGLDYAEKTYPFIDKDRECALGASYGGYMINWILGHTDRFKCLVSHDGMFNAESAWGTTEELWFNNWEFKGTPYDNRAGYEKWSPHQYAKNFKTPTLVIHGQRDYRLDVSEGFQLFTTLQMEGVPSKMLYFPDEGHWVQKPQNGKLWYETVNAWVDQWTKK